MAAANMSDLDWVPPGWTAENYADECRRMEAACRAVRPELADEWAARAAALEADRTQKPKNALQPRY